MSDTRSLDADACTTITLVTIGLVGVFLIGAVYGRAHTLHQIHEEAVSIGYAEWYLDDDGKRQWRWVVEHTE